MRADSPLATTSSPTISAIELPESAREVAQQHHRRVALACLEIGEVTLRHAGGFGQPFAGHAATVAQRAHPFAERGQEGIARTFFETSSLVHVVQYLA
jgi:hypothetical protein